MPMFSPATSIIVTTCAPIMQEGLVKAFEGLGYKPEIRSLASFQDDYGLGEEDGATEGPEVEEEDEDDEDDDDDMEGEEDGGNEGDKEMN